MIFFSFLGKGDLDLVFRHSNIKSKSWEEINLLLLKLVPNDRVFFIAKLIKPGGIYSYHKLDGYLLSRDNTTYRERFFDLKREVKEGKKIHWMGMAQKLENKDSGVLVHVLVRNASKRERTSVSLKVPNDLYELVSETSPIQVYLYSLFLS